MEYVSLDYCRNTIFPHIYTRLSHTEPSAQYEEEPSGLKELEKVLHLVESDLFYPTFQEKAAYLICSIAGSQYFSNGNKRLGIMVLVSFFVLNEASSQIVTTKDYQDMMKKVFPLHSWENNLNIGESEPLFLYNLAILIGDRTKWGAGADFDVLKKKVSEMFSELYHLPKA